MKLFLKGDLRAAEKRGDLAEVYRLLQAIQDLEVKRVTTPPPDSWFHKAPVQPEANP